MYLRRIELTDFRGFRSLKWELNSGEEPGWHVLLGPNGSGKSSFLRSLAIAFTGPKEFMAARRPTQEFVRIDKDVDQAGIQISLAPTSPWDSWSGPGAPAKSLIRADISLSLDGTTKGSKGSVERTVWGDGTGWFSAAFGPMRRFAGGNLEHVRLFTAYPKLARHLSIFGEDVALTEALEWLRQLRFKQLEQQAVSGGDSGMLSRIKAFVNQDGFLPYGAQLLDVSSEEVRFVDGNQVELPVGSLSDGYRAVLSLTFELIRLMSGTYDSTDIFSPDGTQVLAPGVVLVDEIDAHLHPTWQRDIGPWLTKLFPGVQFIVTTHSPYVCQSARPGSVWRLPAPGSDEPLQRIEGSQLDRVLYGDVLQVLNSDAFGGLAGRSDRALAGFERLAALRRTRARDGLNASQRQELARLEEVLMPAASTALTQ